MDDEVLLLSYTVCAVFVCFTSEAVYAPLGNILSVSTAGNLDVCTVSSCNCAGDVTCGSHFGSCVKSQSIIAENNCTVARNVQLTAEHFKLSLGCGSNSQFTCYVYSTVNTAVLIKCANYVILLSSGGNRAGCIDVHHTVDTQRTGRCNRAVREVVGRAYAILDVVLRSQNAIVKGYVPGCGSTALCIIVCKACSRYIGVCKRPVICAVSILPRRTAKFNVSIVNSQIAGACTANADAAGAIELKRRSLAGGIEVMCILDFTVYGDVTVVAQNKTGNKKRCALIYDQFEVRTVDTGGNGVCSVEIDIAREISCACTFNRGVSQTCVGNVEFTLIGNRTVNIQYAALNLDNADTADMQHICLVGTLNGHNTVAFAANAHTVFVHYNNSRSGFDSKGCGLISTVRGFACIATVCIATAIYGQGAVAINNNFVSVDQIIQFDGGILNHQNTVIDGIIASLAAGNMNTGGCNSLLSVGSDVCTVKDNFTVAFAAATDKEVTLRPVNDCATGNSNSLVTHNRTCHGNNGVTGNQGDRIAILCSCESVCECKVILVVNLRYMFKQCFAAVRNVFDRYIGNVSTRISAIAADCTVVGCTAGKCNVFNRAIFDSTVAKIPTEHTAGVIRAHVDVFNRTTGCNTVSRTGTCDTAAEPTAGNGNILNRAVFIRFNIISMTYDTGNVTSVATAGVLDVADSFIAAVYSDVLIIAISPTTYDNTCASVAGVGCFYLNSTVYSNILSKCLTAACATCHNTRAFATGNSGIGERYILKRTIKRSDKANVGNAGFIDSQIADRMILTVECTLKGNGFPFGAGKINICNELNSFACFTSNKCFAEISITGFADLSNEGYGSKNSFATNFNRKVIGCICVAALLVVPEAIAGNVAVAKACSRSSSVDRDVRAFGEARIDFDSSLAVYGSSSNKVCVNNIEVDKVACTLVINENCFTYGVEGTLIECNFLSTVRPYVVSVCTVLIERTVVERFRYAVEEYLTVERTVVVNKVSGVLETCVVYVRIVIKRYVVERYVRATHVLSADVIKYNTVNSTCNCDALSGRNSVCACNEDLYFVACVCSCECSLKS